MTALLGKTLLFAGCTAFGLLRGSRLRQRTACLGEFRRTLAGLAREPVSYTHLTLPTN